MILQIYTRFQPGSTQKPPGTPRSGLPSARRPGGCLPAGLRWRRCRRQRRALGGQGGGQLAPRVDAELGEHLAQVIGNRRWADEKLLGNLPVGSPAARWPGDERFLGGERLGGLP